MGGRTVSRILLALCTVLLLLPAGGAEAAPTATCPRTWRRVPSASPGAVENYLYGIATTHGGPSWAVGTTSASGTLQSLTERWSGSAWTDVASPNLSRNNVLEGVAVLSANNAWAVGEHGAYNPPAPGWAPLIEHWHGGAWQSSPVAAPTDSAFLLGVSADAADDVWAVGYGYDVQGPVVTLVEHFDGAAWSVVPAPAGSERGYLFGVAALGPADVALAARWDGTSWSALLGPVAFTPAAVAARGDGVAWAVGWTNPGTGFQAAAAKVCAG